MEYHNPVLLNECLEGLNIKEDGIYVDATYGGGGHAKAITEKLSTGKLIAFDQDEDAMNQNLSLTAREIINTYPEKELQRIFSEYGEIINSKRLAATIADARREKEIDTITELKSVIKSCVNKVNENQYYAQVFQALRIEV